MNDIFFQSIAELENGLLSKTGIPASLPQNYVQDDFLALKEAVFPTIFKTYYKKVEAEPFLKQLFALEKDLLIYLKSDLKKDLYFIYLYLSLIYYYRNK